MGGKDSKPLFYIIHPRAEGQSICRKLSFGVHDARDRLGGLCRHTCEHNGSQINVGN